MPTTPYLPPPPTTQGSALSATDHGWLLIVQGLQPLYEVDTSKGSYTEAVPAAGVASSGQTAQCKEITYVKTSADGNTYTLTGVKGGNLILTAQYSTFKIKSDGTNWYLDSPAVGGGGGAVSSVFGRAGAVVAENADYSAFYDESGAAAAAQAAAEAASDPAGSAAAAQSAAEAASDPLGAATAALAAAETYANSVNTSGTAANLSGTPALPNGTTATTQAALNNSTKLGTTAYADAAVAVEATATTTAIGVETTRALAAEALLAPLSGSAFYTGNITSTQTAVAPGVSPATAGFELWQNTTPTVTGAATTVALSTTVAPTNPSGNIWVYTLAAAESGAGSNGWAKASAVFSGFTGTSTGNNGTFIITASTTTTVTVTNPTGTTLHAGTPVMISSAVVNSPILELAGTVNTGTAGALASSADTWSIQNVIGSLVPNPTSTLTFTHTGSSGTAALAVTNLNVTTITAPTNMVLNAASGEIVFDTGGTNNFLIQGTAFRAGSLSIIGFSSTAIPSGAGTDTGMSRTAAGVMAIGNGAQGSTTGAIALTTIQFTASASAPTSAGTAGTAGQIIYFSGLVYFCSVTGAAGAATWNKLNMTAV
jgi:hypothetical protein